MKKRNILYLVAAALLTGCSADEQPDNVKGLVPITLNTLMVEGNLTRNNDMINVQSTQFDPGETFYTFFPSNVKVGSVTENSSTTFTTAADGSTTPTSQPYFNEGANGMQATVHAYYPYVADGKQVTNNTTSFSVEKDQYLTPSYKASDLMYATTTVEKNGATANGTLTFTHKMAKIIVIANADAGITINAVRIVGGYRTISVTDGTTCTLSTTAEGLSNANSTAADNYITMLTGGSTTTAVCAALLPPQTLSGAFLQILTSEGTATYSVDKTLESGNSYTLNLSVTQSSINHTTAISNWSNNSGSTNSGELVIGEIEDEDYYCLDNDESIFMPEPEVTCNGIPLTKGENYEIVYFKNNNPGTGIVLVFGKGDYEGKSANKTFNIKHLPISQVNNTHVGCIICSSGHLHSTVAKATAAGCTPCAIIAYLGETGTVETNSAYKGLAIALADAGKFSWYTRNEGHCVSQTSDVTIAITYKNGIACTETLSNSNGSGVTTYCSNHTHNAAIACINYNTARPEDDTSEWFLPSVGQWNLIVQGLATKKAGAAITTDLTMYTNATYKYSNLNSVIEDAGADGFESAFYWTSTEYNYEDPWLIRFDDGYATCSYKTYDFYVRPVLAF